MTDTTLNRFLAGDTDAVRTGFTPSVPTPASGPKQGYYFYEYDTNTLWLYNTNNTTWYPVLGGGVLSPASIGSSQNNYNPAGLGTCTILRLTASLAVNITGLTAPGTGQQLILVAVLAGSSAITFTNEDASSTAANRFDMVSSLVAAAGTTALFMYDTTSSRWRVVGGAAAGSSGTVTSIATDNTYATGGTITTTGTITVTALAKSSIDSALHRMLGGI